MTEDSKIIILRHAEAAYPDDVLSSRGVIQALEKAGLFSEVDITLSSPQQRAIETASLLGCSDILTDSRLAELELPDINASTAAEYVMMAHELAPEAIQAKAAALQESLQSLGLLLGLDDGSALVISHNLAMSGLRLSLTGEKVAFENLQGFELEVGPDGKLIFLGDILI